jgi:hypothetical protein
MLPRAYIDASEKFFIDKHLAKSYLLEIGVEGVGGSSQTQEEKIEVDNSDRIKDKTFYLYEIKIKLDLEDVINSKINNFKIYLTNNESESGLVDQQYNNFAGKSTESLSENAVANIFNNERLAITETLVNRFNSKSFLLTSLDPKVFVDLERYKNNFRGTSSDKFGYISGIESYIAKPILDASNNTNIGSSETAINASQKKISRKIEVGLYAGQPITEIMELYNLSASRRKKVDKQWGRHQKIKRSEVKTQFHYSETKTRENLIPEFEKSKSLRKTVVDKKKSSSQVRSVSFILKIKNKDLVKSNIRENKFGIILEAEDRNSTVLDRQFVNIDIENDVKYHLISFENLSVSQSIQSNTAILSFLSGENNASNKNKSLEDIQMNMHLKSLKRNTALYNHSFEDTFFKRSVNPNRQAIIKIKTGTGREESFQNMSNISYDVKSFANPSFFRFTPTIQDLKFDNFWEVGINSLNRVYRNKFIPFIVKSINIEGQECAKIEIDIASIPLRYKRLKVFKKDRNQTLFGNYQDNLKEVYDKLGNVIKPIDIKRNLDVDSKNKIVSIIDYNVEANKLYEYRIELFEGVKKVGRSFSSSFFQEKIEKKDGVVSFSQNTSVGRTAQAFSKNIKCRIVETDAEKSFKNLLGNKYDLFKSELDKVKDITTNAIAVKLERLCLNDCTIKTIEYIPVNDSDQSRSDQGNTNTNDVNFSISDTGLDPGKDYIYKLTACLKPIEELLAGIDEEIIIRSKGEKKSFKQFKHAAVRRKIKNLSNDVLYSLASKIANQSRGKINDFETMSGLNNGNTFSTASTGDILYINAYASKQSVTRQKPIANLTHKNTISRIIKNKNNLGDRYHKNKIILEFVCDISKEIDHAVIFLNNNGIIDYCCNLHAQASKRDYRVLIEKENLSGNCEFLIYPINKKGKIYSPILIDTISL